MFDVGCSILVEPDCACPEGEDGERLVRPTEVAPYDVEVDEHHGEDAAEQRQGDHEALEAGFLVDVHEVGYDQSCGAQGGVAGGDRRGDDADDSQYATHCAEP